MKYKWTQKNKLLRSSVLEESETLQPNWTSSRQRMGGGEKIHILDIHVSWSLFELQNMKCH